MTVARIIAILVEIAIASALKYWLDVRWYISIPSAVMGYLITRYVRWVIEEWGHLSQARDQLLKKLKRGPGNQNSN